MAINDMIMHFPKIDHAYSNSKELLPHWVKCRRTGLNKDFKTHSRMDSKGGYADYEHDLPGGGSSALNAVILGLKLGYDKIVLAGIPLDNSPHYFDPPWEKSNFKNEIPDKDNGLKYWNSYLDQMKGKVFSMSGRTKQLLG